MLADMRRRFGAVWTARVGAKHGAAKKVAEFFGGADVDAARISGP
jgi:hypothetical protein